MNETKPEEVCFGCHQCRWCCENILLCWLLKDVLSGALSLKKATAKWNPQGFYSNRDWCHDLWWELEEKDLMVLKTHDFFHQNSQRKTESVIICPYFGRIYKILILAQPRLFSEPWCFPTSQCRLHLKNLKLLLFISLQMGKWPTWWKTPQMWGKFSQQIATLMISPHHRNKGIMKGWETSELFAEDEKKKIGFMFSNFDYGKMMSPSFPWATDLGCCH